MIGLDHRDIKKRDEIASLGMDQWSEKLMAQRFHPGAISEAMWRWFHDVQRAAEPRACVYLLDMLMRVDLTERLKDITTPTLIIAPDDSPFVSVESAVERRPRAMPNARLQVVADARHGVRFSHGRGCARVLKGVDHLQNIGGSVASERCTLGK